MGIKLYGCQYVSHAVLETLNSKSPSKSNRLGTIHDLKRKLKELKNPLTGLPLLRDISLTSKGSIVDVSYSWREPATLADTPKKISSYLHKRKPTQLGLAYYGQ